MKEQGFGGRGVVVPVSRDLISNFTENQLVKPGGKFYRKAYKLFWGQGKPFFEGKASRVKSGPFRVGHGTLIS